MSEIDLHVKPTERQIENLLGQALALADADRLTATAARIAHAIDTLNQMRGPTPVDRLGFRAPTCVPGV
jgi:hypothetical protein